MIDMKQRWEYDGIGTYQWQLKTGALYVTMHDDGGTIAYAVGGVYRESIRYESKTGDVLVNVMREQKGRTRYSTKQENLRHVLKYADVFLECQGLCKRARTLAHIILDAF